MQKLFRERLEKGMRGIDVAVLQGWLLGAGLAVEGLIPDGEYGERTVESVKALRSQCGLPDVESGRFTPMLRERLREGITGVLQVDFDSFIIDDVVSSAVLSESFPTVRSP